jgi:predicted nucleic acid-binding protein
VRFWDTSAWVPLLLAEPATPAVEAVLREDPDPVVWWGSAVESASALAAAARHGRLSPADLQTALATLRAMREFAFEIGPTEEVRSRAIRLLAVHPLRASDALQLAAGLVWCREQTAGAGLVSLDDRLRAAAVQEGFDVLPRERGGAGLPAAR